jgi:hypothetical protein
MPGTIRRSNNGISNWEQGPVLFTPNMRHAAVSLENDTLYVFFSNAYDCPECILWSKIKLSANWHNWTASQPEILLTPKTTYEGFDCPIEASKRGAVHKRVHQLRDPCIYKEAGRTYLLYTIAGESGIGIAEIFFE